MQNLWNKYIEYLKLLANTHSDDSFMGMSPVCFDEFEDNESEEHYDNG